MTEDLKDKLKQALMEHAESSGSHQVEPTADKKTKKSRSRITRLLMIGSVAIAISMLTFTIVPAPVNDQGRSQPKSYPIKKPKIEITINAEAAGNEFPIVKLRLGPGCATSRR